MCHLLFACLRRGKSLMDACRVHGVLSTMRGLKS